MCPMSYWDGLVHIRVMLSCVIHGNLPNAIKQSVKAHRPLVDTVVVTLKYPYLWLRLSYMSGITRIQDRSILSLCLYLHRTNPIS